MKKKFLKIAMFFAMPVVAFLTLAIFLVSGFTSGFVSALSGNGGVFFVGSSSKLEISEGTTISGNSATNGGGVYVENGGTLNMTGGTISGNTATSGNGNNIYNAGTFTMNGGSVEDKVVYVNDIIEFGSYPKTHQSDTSVITDITDENGYYIGTDGISRYAKVSANPCGYPYYFKDGTTIVSEETYYFKVEPIKWRVLKIENGSALLLCENIINAMWYDDDVSEEAKYSNSEIRAYLNGYSTDYGSSYLNNGLFQKAFTLEEQDSILTSEISVVESESIILKDKIFLLSYSDLENSDFGFSPDHRDKKRKRETTDYAIANGAYYSYTSSFDTYVGSWWLVDTYEASGFLSARSSVVTNGGARDSSNITATSVGVVPALYISGYEKFDISILNDTSTGENEYNIYNIGSFTINDGKIGTNIKKQVGYGIHNAGTINFYGGTIYDNIYSETSFNTKMNANINGTITLGDYSAIINVLDYEGITPEYNIIIDDSKLQKIVLTLQGSSVVPDLSKLNVMNSDGDSYLIEAVQGSSSTEWNIVVGEIPGYAGIEFPADWKTQIASEEYIKNGLAIEPKEITSIIFDRRIPSGYDTHAGYLFGGIDVYTNTSHGEYAFINMTGTIYAPADCSNLFSELPCLKTLIFNNFDTSNVTNMRYMFKSCSSLTSLDVSGFDTSNVTNMYMMFYYCYGLTSLNVSGFDTSNVRNMSYMFYYCDTVTSLNVSGFDTSNVSAMGDMFCMCKSLTSLDVSGFDTSNVRGMKYMFHGCLKLTSLDVGGFDTSNVIEMKDMFVGCSGLTSLDVRGFDTSNVTDMEYMFSGCSGLTSLDVRGFDTSNVTNMRYMFYGCSGLTSLDLSGFNTSNVTNMVNMFYGCSSLTSLNVSGFDTSNVTEMGTMFYNCSSLVILDLSSFDMKNVTRSSMMLYFGSSGNLKLLKTPYNNTSALTITNGNNLYNISTGYYVSSVPANNSSSLTLAERYVVVFDSNGGICSTESKNVYYDRVIGELPTSTRNGCGFIGWFTEPNGGTQINESSTITSNVTVYAHWSYIRVDENGNVDPDGDYVLFGSYPKTYQSDTSVITFTKDENGYYLGTDGNRYAKVSASPNKSSYVFNDGTTIVSGTEYYFKVEPIKWRILKTENGKALLFCEDIIDVQKYNRSDLNETINGSTISANNYKYSDIRAWLNGYGQESGKTNGENWLGTGFLQKAFTTAEQNLILTTEIDNSASTTNSSSNSFACENTIDKIFLLSYQDMINTAYRFNSSFSNKDSSRRKKLTDFTRANYAWYSTSSDYLYNGFYWLRSPSSSDGIYAYYVRYYGDLAYANDFVYANDYGVSPALWLDLGTGVTTFDAESGIGLTENESDDTCVIQNRTVYESFLAEESVVLIPENKKLVLEEIFKIDNDCDNE